MKQESICYFQLGDLSLKASVYYSENTNVNETILYFHGGGLMYGSRADLPDSYISSFLNAGYHFIAFDYPLAPESSFNDIYLSVKEGVKWFLKEAEESLNMNTSDYILFGRSAGAYLCFLLARESSLPSPTRIINFYGYDSLEYKEFLEPSRHYSSYPKLPEHMIKQMIQAKPLSSGSLQTRFALYLYARQTGKWIDFLTLSSDLKKYSLTQKETESLPPTFIAHSTDDQDVPYSIAEYLHHTIPHSTLHTVTDMEHDFDRYSESEKAQKAYTDLLNWLKTDI